MKWMVRIGAGLAVVVALAAGGLWLAGRGKGQGHVHRTVELARPASQVWPLISEPEKLREWQSGLVENQLLTAGGVRPGARLRQVRQLGRERMTLLVEITSLQPGRRLAATLHSEGPGLAMSVDYLLLERDGHTVLDYKGDFELEHWAAKAFTGSVMADAQRKLDADLLTLRRLVESLPPARAVQPAFATQPVASPPDAQPAATPPQARPASATAR